MASPLSPADLTLFAKAPLYNALPAAARHDLLQRCRVQELKRGEALFHQGDLAETLFMVLEGWIKVYRLSAEGGEVVLHMFHSGETFAEPAAFGLGRYPATAEAATHARVLTIPAAALMAEIDRSPGLAMKVIATLSQRLHSLIADTERRHFLSTAHRVGAFLLDCAPPAINSENTVAFDLPYDKALVAARLGMTPESFSRALAKLKPYAVKSTGGRILLGDIRQLKAFCSPDGL
jgi:CRP-like cAMP-binding protein